MTRTDRQDLDYGGTLLTEPEVEVITNGGVQEPKIRSGMTREAANGVRCLLRTRSARGTPGRHGRGGGVIAAQSIGEPGTSSTMRTFHIGGAAQISEQSFIESNFDGKAVPMGSNAKNSITKWRWCAHGRRGRRPRWHRACISPHPYGARMRAEDGDKIKRGQRIAEWDPYTRPRPTEAKAPSSSKTWSTAADVGSTRRSRPALLSAWSSIGDGFLTQSAGPASGNPDQVGQQDLSSPAVVRRVTSSPSMRSSRSIRVVT